MTEKDPQKTLHTFLSEYSSPLELAAHIDRGMLIIVLFLRHEPEYLEVLIESYESLYGLKNLILNQVP